ncbi:hypothetical protein RIR_jg8747.t1 [Rhizophagus irregularis DAOM 181602=DAOM 197198]|nr:hypothetical protein RIR_jg8747.t1 [Rhizophagus irregularis DAOM 181602=DAOM 197198]
MNDRHITRYFLSKIFIHYLSLPPYVSNETVKCIEHYNKLCNKLGLVNHKIIRVKSTHFVLLSFQGNFPN